MIEVQVALYHDRTGCLGEFVRGTEDKTLGHPLWITPGLTFETSGAAVYAFHVTPERHAYQGVITFQIWDKRSQSNIKLVATITINTSDDTYHISLEPYYRRRRLNTTFHVHGHYNRTPAPVVFRHPTHYGPDVRDNTV